MATVIHVYTIEHAAKLLGEDPELIDAIIANDDNLSYGTIISICNGTGESVTALTRLGIE
jgi:plasmid maintenance system antidote protein VapI